MKDFLKARILFLRDYRKDRMIRILMIGLILFFFIFLLQKNAIISGSETYQLRFRGERDGITMAKSIGDPEKNLKTKERYLRLTTSPVSFSFRRPFFADTMEVKIKTNDHPYPVVEIGVPWKEEGSQTAGDGIKFFPLDLPITDRMIASDQFEQFDERDNIVFLQKKSKQNPEGMTSKSQDFFEGNQKRLINETDFFESDLSNKRVGYFNIQPIDLYQIPGYEEMPKTLAFNQTFRGSHLIKVYIAKDRPLDFQFHFIDKNQKEGPDPVRIQFLDVNNTIVKDWKLKDDGKTKSDFQQTDLGQTNIFLSGIPTSVYYLSIEATPDIYFTDLKTKNPLFGFVGRLVLADFDQSTELFSSATSYAFLSNRKTGLQMFDIADQTVEILEIAEPVNVAVNPGFYQFTVPKSDLVITMNGLIALHRDVKPLISQHIEIINPLSDWSVYDYILVGKDWGAKKKKTKKGDTIVSRTFDVNDLAPSKDRVMNIHLRIPGLEYGRDQVFMKEINITVKRRPWKEVFQIIRNKLPVL